MGLVTTTLQTVGATGLIGDAINVGFAYSDYNHARKQGNSRAVSLGKAAGAFAWGEFFYGGLARSTSGALAKAGISGFAGTALSMGAALGAGLLMSSGQLIGTMGEHTAKTMAHGHNQRGKLGSGYFDMSQAGYTMRQRSLNAIRSNGLNTQSVLGNEARTYYRGSL